MPTSTKTNGLKDSVNYVVSHLPQRSLTKQALKRLATALKRKSGTCSCSQDDNVKKSRLSCSCHDKKSPSFYETPSEDFTENTEPPKRVSFCAKVDVSTTIGRHQISSQEREQTWYHEKEFLDIADDCFALVQRSRRGKYTECPRGLERLTKIGMKQAMENRRAAVNLVLDEQDRQEMEGVCDDEYTAFLYHSISSSCHLWAAVVGLHDQKEAQLEYSDSDFQAWLGEPVILTRSTKRQVTTTPSVPRRSAFLRSIQGARAA